MNTQHPQNIFSYRQYWAKRFGIAKFLPMSQDEMEELGWDSCDIILVTGDAYVDHPSFGMALIGRLLESQGFRVGIISQPDWHNCESFKILGKPNICFAVTAGNMDSMVNHYTSDKKIRSDDAYTPNGLSNKRPNRATIVYSHRCREAYNDIPIILGGIEASLRRVAHYDYWSDQVRRSVLVDAKADILLYGNAERALVEVVHRLAKKETIADMQDIRGTVVIKKHLPTTMQIIDCSQGYTDTQPHKNTDLASYILLPAFSDIHDNKRLYAYASRQLHLETKPFHARPLAQQHSDRYIWINPPPIPLTTQELDKVYALPYQRCPHPGYENANIPAYEMIRFSVTIMRGCFGGCSFCAITAHEGRIIQSRSQQSILHEVNEIKDKTLGFTGIISDLGGPSANMYCQNCKSLENENFNCRKFSCLHPQVCQNLNTNHKELINLYKNAREISGIKKVLIGSGVRYDLAIKSPEYTKELVTHHVGGYLKIAPEHICPQTLDFMLKPKIEIYDKFQELFNQYSAEANKEQYLIPYFISAHPGTTDEEMLELAIWLKKNNYRLDKVQSFLPTPMTLATTMYYTGYNPLNPIDTKAQKMFIPNKGKTRKLHKAFLRYHDPKNWQTLRQALKNMKREDLIGNGKKHLVPTWQPYEENYRNNRHN